MLRHCRGHIAALAILVALGSALPVQLVAQNDADGDTTSLRTYCLRDRARLARHSAGDGYANALSGIQSCGAMAGEVLARQWRDPPTDSAAIMLLGEVSANVRDRRVYQAASDVALSPGAPTTTRLAAIATLVAHADSTVRLSYFTFPEPPVVPKPGVMLGRLTHLPGLPPTGAPLPGSVWSDVVSLLGQLGESDPDDRVRSVAAYVAKRMRAHLY